MKSARISGRVNHLKRLQAQQKRDLANDLSLSYTLVHYVKSKAPAVRQVVSILFYAMKAQETSPTISPERYKHHFERITLNLYRHHDRPFRRWAAIDFNSQAYNGVGVNKGLSVYIMRTVCDFLESEGYIIKHNGFRDRKRNLGRTTRIRATGKLLALFERAQVNAATIQVDHNAADVIIMRDREKNEVAFEETKRSRIRASHIKRFNEIYRSTKFTLAMTPEELELCRPDIEIPEIGLPVMESPQFRRVFNNETFKDGGRLYCIDGGYQNWAKELRLKILINGKVVIELDYSALHPTMLYHLEGLELKQDPYIIFNHPDKRKFLKYFILRMINSTDRDRFPKTITYAVQTGKMDPIYQHNTSASYRRLMLAVEKHHAPIAKYFFTGYGVKLQRKDSDITEEILLRFLRQKPMLPVSSDAVSSKAVLPLNEYDSFICAYDQAAFLKQVMLESYQKIMRTNFEIKIS